MFLCSLYRKEKSWNGYTLDVLKSGLQKYIRRGMTDKALYCAGELDLFKYSPERGEGIRTNFIHRLMIIYLEDIGIANLGMWMPLDQCLTSVLDERCKSDRDVEKEERILYSIVTSLCDSEKSRSCSHARAISSPVPSAMELSKQFYPSIYQLHTSVASGDFSFYCEQFDISMKTKQWTALWYAQKIVDSDEKVKEYRKTKPVWRLFRLIEKHLPDRLKPLHTLAMAWYKELENLKENFLCWMVLVLAILQDVPIQTTTLSIVDEGSWNSNREEDVLDIDEYVLDKHTRHGRSSTLSRFAQEGAFVNNESHLVIQEHKRFYEELKGSIIKRETDYTFIVRTQLTTSRAKTDVYFADDPLGNLVVMKGPLASQKIAQRMVDHQEWKKRHGIPCIDVTVEMLIPNRWLEGTPLGLRNTVDRSKYAPFLVSKSVVSKDVLDNRRIHSGKVWPPTEIVDWSKVSLHFHIENLSKVEITDYMTALLMRYVFGISDLADRNFLMTQGRVISIDEEIFDNKVNFMIELKKNRCAFIKEWLINNHSNLLLDWDVDDKYNERLVSVQSKDQCIQLFSA